MSPGFEVTNLGMRYGKAQVLSEVNLRFDFSQLTALAGPNGAGGSVIDGNAPAKFKQPGLGHMIQYDPYPRKSLVDHWYDDDASLATVARGEALERGDFLGLPFEAKLRRNASVRRAGSSPR